MAAALALVCCALYSTAPAATSPSHEANPLSVSPRDWAVDASNNEIAVINHPGTYLRYRMHVVDQKGDQMRDVIESRDGTVARLIERDGRPLTPDEDKAEQKRLNDLLDSPDSYQKHESSDVNGKKRAIALIHMLPDAMLFSYTPGQPQLDNLAGEQVVIDYKPNPQWKPPNTSSEGLTGLQGRAWIDVKTHHMVRMEGEVFQGINFGWGVLAHIYPGGKLAVEQAPVDGPRWIFVAFEMQLAVRALMVKTLHQNTRVNTMAFAPVAPMSYQDAIHLLLATPLPH